MRSAFEQLKTRDILIKNILDSILSIKLESNKHLVKHGTLLHTIPYSKLSDWDVKDYIKQTSAKFKALHSKISHIFNKHYDYAGAERLIESICDNRIKKLTQPDKTGGDFLGYGHFRWNYKAYTLTEEEINKLREVFYN